MIFFLHTALPVIFCTIHVQQKYHLTFSYIGKLTKYFKKYTETIYMHFLVYILVITQNDIGIKELSDVQFM